MPTFCPVCGSSLPDAAIFCWNCGRRILQNNPDARREAVLVSPIERIVLGTEAVTIGRDPDNKLIVKDDPQVSRHHAGVRQEGANHVILDLGSANGTFVNGQRLEVNIPHLLHDNDTIRVGSTVLTYSNQQSVSPPPETQQEQFMVPPSRIASPDHSPGATPQPGFMTPPPRITFPNRTAADAMPPYGAFATPPTIAFPDYSPGAAPPPIMGNFENTGALAPPPAMLAPPVAICAPPLVARRLPLLVIGLVLVLVLIPVMLSLVVKNTPNGSSSSAPSVAGSWSVLLFFCQMLILIVVVCLVPTVVTWILRRARYVVRVFVESLAFIVVFLGFGFWLFGRSALGIWILYASALTVLIEAGSHFVKWRKDTTLKRLKDGISYKSIEADAEAIKQMARYEVALYIPVPVGLIVGTIIGLLRHQTTLQIVEFCVQLVLFLVALVLLYFLVVGFLRMSDPLFRTIPRSSTELTKRGRTGKKTAKAPPRSQEAQDQQYIDLACDVSGLRTIYKYDALHNTILLVAFTLVVIKIWLVPIGLSWLIVSLLLATLIFSEIPYAIGQYLLHNRILEQYTGGKYAEMAKKLQDYAPIFPPLPFLAALLTSGTAGGILYALLSQLAQNTITTLIK